MNTLPFFIVLGILTAIAATVLAFIFILPEKKRAKLPKILKIISDILNMKQLFLEIFFRALYIFSTFACIFVGVFMIFGFESYGRYTHWYGGVGLLIAILGPIAVRVVYEGFMMFVLLVKNSIEINKKLKNQNNEEIETRIGE